MRTDARTLDQRRADIFADMMLAGAPVAVGEGIDAIRAHVQVTVPVLTLAGVHDEGRISPDTARSTLTPPAASRVTRKAGIAS